MFCGEQTIEGHVKKKKIITSFSHFQGLQDLFEHYVFFWNHRTFAIEQSLYIVIMEAIRASLVAQLVKNLPALQETSV